MCCERLNCVVRLWSDSARMRRTRRTTPRRSPSSTRRYVDACSLFHSLGNVTRLFSLVSYSSGARFGGKPYRSSVAYSVWRPRGFRPRCRAAFGRGVRSPSAVCRRGSGLSTLVALASTTVCIHSPRACTTTIVVVPICYDLA